jgi:hypothetical protein
MSEPSTASREPAADFQAAHPHLEVEFTNTVDDLRVLGRYGWRWWSPLVIVAAALGCSLPGALFLVVCGHWVVASVVSCGLAGCAVWLMYRNWHAAPAKNSKFLVKRRCVLTPEEFVQQTPDSLGRWRWAYLREVIDYQGSLLVGVEHGWWVIPASAFGSREHRARFSQELTTRQRDAAQPVGEEPLPPAAEPARDALQVRFRNTRALRQRAADRARGAKPGEWQAWLGLVVILATCGVGMQSFPPDEAIGWLSATLLHVTSTLLVILVASRAAFWFSARRGWRLRLPERAVITPAGVRSTTPYYDTFVNWKNFEGVEDDAHAIYIIYVKASGQLTAIPKSAFPNQAEAGAFLAAAREYFERAAASGQQSGQGPARLAPGASPITPEETGNPYQPPRN